MDSKAPRSPARQALVGARERLGRAIAHPVAALPSLEPPFIRISRWAARRSRLLFGLCWEVNRALNERLRQNGHRFREVTLGPLRLQLDVTDLSGFGPYFYGDPYEPQLTDYLVAELKPGDVFIDVGANVGLFSLIAASLIGAAGRVVAFEPHPGARADLLDSVDRNGVSGIVEVVGMALSDQPGANIPLHLAERTGLSTLDLSAAPNFLDAAYSGSVPVDVTTLDLWIDQHPDWRDRIAVIKIDVEGSEERVLAGMQRTIEAVRALRIVCETREDSGADRLLQAAGFSASALEPPDAAYPGNRLYRRTT